jgi:hypothetical protein
VTPAGAAALSAVSISHGFEFAYKLTSSVIIVRCGAEFAFQKYRLSGPFQSCDNGFKYFSSFILTQTEPSIRWSRITAAVDHPPTEPTTEMQVSESTCTSLWKARQRVDSAVRVSGARHPCLPRILSLIVECLRAVSSSLRTRWVQSEAVGI